MDDIAAGVNEFDELIPVSRKVFDCLRTSETQKLSTHKCEFGKAKIDYVGSIITPKGTSPKVPKLGNSWTITACQAQQNKYNASPDLSFFRNFLPKLGDKLLYFCRLLRKENAFTITNAHHESLETLKHDLTRATNLTLSLAKPVRQYVILCDASLHGSGFVPMIEV